MIWKATRGGSISLNTHAGKIQNYLDNEYEAHDYTNSNKFGFGFSSATNLGSYSMAYNIGYGTLGFNTTFGLGWNNYLTLNVGIPTGGELILQRKLFQFTDNQPGGITIGAFIKREYYSYFEKPNSTFDIQIIPKNWAPVDLYGGRSMFHFGFLHGTIIHGFVSYGHSPQLNSGLFNIGILLGTDIFK